MNQDYYQQQPYGQQQSYGQQQPYGQHYGQQQPYGQQTPNDRPQQPMDYYQPPSHPAGYYQERQDEYSSQGSYVSENYHSTGQQYSEHYEGQDRGIMGAMAGAAAGGYGGHKFGGHGFLGALAGAFAGHKMEDAFKHRDEEKKHEQQQQQQVAPAGGNHSQSGNAQPEGNFHASSYKICLDEDYNLVAKCAALDGRYYWSIFPLNEFIGNNDGRFEWTSEGDGDFLASAKHVKLIDDGKGLKAELYGLDGRWHTSKICLNERITNENGELGILD
ncbi:MAG: hypothetical protein Q9227_006857 [Pyrenula ochraceoflavens]